MQPPEPLSPTEQLSDSMTDNDPEPLTTSALARLERHLGSRQPHPSSTGYNYADIDRLSHQAVCPRRIDPHWLADLHDPQVIDTGRRQIRSTESLGHRVKTLEDAAARTIGGEGLTPKGKLQRKKDIAWTKMELQKRQRMLDTEMKDVKGRLAKAEAKAEKKAVGKGAMDIDNPW